MENCNSCKSEYITVIFKSTCQCNINCTYCYDKQQREKFKKTVVTREIIEHTAKLLSDYSKHVIWTWHGGESTVLGKQFFIDAQDVFYKYYDTRFEQTMQSNGVLVLDDYSWVDELNDYGISIGLSFDIYSQSIRTGNKYTEDEILQKYVNLIKHMMDVYKGPQGGLSVIHNKNVHKMIDMYEHMKSNLGEFGLSFNFVFNACGNTDHNLGISLEDYIIYYPKFLTHMMFDTSETPLLERSVNVYLGAYVNSVQGKLCHNSDCRKKWIGIQPDGTVSYCDRELDGDYFIGNILDYNSIDDIFNSEGYQNQLRDIEKRFTNICSKCIYFPYCNGGCHNNHASGNDGKLDGCSEAECMEFQQNFLSMIDILQQVRITDYINYKVLAEILRHNTLIPCEVEYFFNELNIQLNLNINVSNYRYTPNELENDTRFKLLMYFRGFGESSNISIPTDNTKNSLSYYITNRRELFNSLYQRNKNEIDVLLEELK